MKKMNYFLLFLLAGPVLQAMEPATPETESSEEIPSKKRKIGEVSEEYMQPRKKQEIDILETARRELAENPNAPHHAAEGGNVEKLKAFLELGIDVDSRDDSGNTPLHFAAAFGKNKAIELLFKNGADIEAINDEGQTPLHSAAEGGIEKAIKLLVQNNANLEARDNNDMTPFALLVSTVENFSDPDFYDNVLFLIEEGAMVNVADINNDTLIHHAVINPWNMAEFRDLVDYFATQGGNLEAKNDNGQTPLDLAVEFRRFNNARVILDKLEELDQLGRLPQ